MPPKSEKKQHKVTSKKDSYTINGSPLQPVAGGGALANNLPSVSTGVVDLTQADMYAGLESTTPTPSENLPPLLPKVENPAKKKVGEPNFQGGDAKPPQHEQVPPDMIAVERILKSLNEFNGLFLSKQPVGGLRKSFKGKPRTKKVFDSRFSFECSPVFVVEQFLMQLGLDGVNTKKPKDTNPMSLTQRSAAFEKTAHDPHTKKGDKKKSNNPVDVPSTVPVVKKQSLEEVFQMLFGTDPLPISSFFDDMVVKKQDLVITPELIAKVWSFLKEPTLEAFNVLFDQNSGKPTDRHQRNLTVFKYVLSAYFSVSEKAHSGLDQDGLASQMRFFLKLMSAQNQKCLFESSRTDQFLYELAIELLIKLGRDTKMISFDDASSCEAAIVILIFKNLLRKYNNIEEEDEQFKSILVQLFRTITESFNANNAFLVKELGFDEPTELKAFLVSVSSNSVGLSHNSLLNSDLSRFMLNQKEVWDLIHGKKGIFAWIAETGCGKSTLLLLLAILEAMLSKANVLYIGPETSTINPEYVATIIEVVCQFIERCGHERPVIRLNQFGVAKCEKGVVNLFMTHDVCQCLPLLSSAFSHTPSIVAVDDNTQLTPKHLKELFKGFNVSQLHICGSTMDLTGCGEVVLIGGGVASSVSFCAPTFIDPSGILPISPSAYREFLIKTNLLFSKWKKTFSGVDFPMGIISFFEKNEPQIQRFYESVSAFAQVESIPFVELVKLARLLHKGVPAFQCGTVYSVKELNEITVLVSKFITILNRIGFVFEDECLQFPKDLSEAQRLNECEALVYDFLKGRYSPIVLTDVNSGYQLEKELVGLSIKATSPNTVNSKVNPSDEGKSILDSNSDSGSDSESDSASAGNAHGNEDEEDQKPRKTKKPKNQKKAHKKKPKTQQKPAEKVDPLSSSAIASAIGDTEAAEAAAAEARAAIECLSANDAVPETASAASADAEDKSNRNLTLAQILERIFKDSASVGGHQSLPSPKFVIEALQILKKCGHPDSARWLKSFIYGVVLLDKIMPKGFIELCLKMYDQGRMMIILAYKLFHLQSWNSKCLRRMKVIVANSVPLWVLRQTIARAGRLGTEHSGEISSWVSCLVLPNSDTSACESISDGRMPLMIGNGDPVCAIESAIMAMMCRGNFSKNHHDFIVDFLRLFRFAYKNEVCHYACVGGRDYFMDFMRFVSGVLVSKFVSPFTCQILRVEDRLAELAFTKFRFGLVDVENVKKSFSSAMLALVGQHSAEVSLCLSRATGTKKFVGISHFDLPQLFKDLYEGYPDSMTSFLKLIRNLLMNLQQTQLCKCDRTVDATVSAMLLVITTTLEFVEDILSLLADKLRERDMEQFRVGFKPTLSPIEQLRELFRSKAGLRLQDLRAFLNVHRHDLLELASHFKDVCDFLGPVPSGRFHVLKEKTVLLKVELEDKEKARIAAELSIKAKPKTLSPLQWVKHQKTQDFIDLCKEVEVRIPQLTAEIQKLKHELASIEKVIGNLPKDFSEVVAYIQKLI